MIALWTAAFRILGRFWRRPVQPWSSQGQEQVWVIAPHPDDEAVGCGGTLLRHRAAGDRVIVVYVTDGRRAFWSGLSPDEVAEQRRAEAAAAAHCLGAEMVWFGLPEGNWTVMELVPLLENLAGLGWPTVIYAPSRIDFHPEHLQVAAAVACWLDRADRSPGEVTVRVYQIQVPLMPQLTNVVSDTASVAETSVLARAAYASQQVSIARADRMQRYATAWYGQPGPVEVFWQLPAAAYCRVHAGDPAGWPAVFRSLRYEPWSDPLAYVRGWLERRRIRGIGVGG